MNARVAYIRNRDFAFNGKSGNNGGKSYDYDNRLFLFY